jgi:hypothetical protein
MTPKEKAIELVNKHLSVYDIIPIAIECALITVDEIQKILYSQKFTLSISAYKNLEDFNHDIKYNDDVRISSIFYFDMVKHEIENLDSEEIW